jgi:hypothetical protein
MVMRAYSEGPGDAIPAPWDERQMEIAPPGTSLGQMDAASLFSEIVSALQLRPLGLVTPWATRKGDLEWEEIINPDTNIQLWGLTDGQINAATQVTFGSPLPFVVVVTRLPLTTSDVAKMWEGTAYAPYETQAVYRQDDAKPVPTMYFAHWGERIDISKLPQKTLAIEPRAKAVGGDLVFAAQVPVSRSDHNPPPGTFRQAYDIQLATTGYAAAKPPAPGPQPIPLAPAPDEPLRLGVPIALGLGAAALGFFLWRNR